MLDHGGDLHLGLCGGLSLGEFFIFLLYAASVNVGLDVLSELTKAAHKAGDLISSKTYFREHIYLAEQAQCEEDDIDLPCRGLKLVC
jgi:hypothetical protein